MWLLLTKKETIQTWIVVFDRNYTIRLDGNEFSSIETFHILQ